MVATGSDLPCLSFVTNMAEGVELMTAIYICILRISFSDYFLKIGLSIFYKNVSVRGPTRVWSRERPDDDGASSGTPFCFVYIQT